jgi:opacity protein-like surface antigen
MRKNRVYGAILLLGLAGTGCIASHAQTSLAVSALGSFSSGTSGNGTLQVPSIHMGGLVQLRHISNPLVGYEATYSYNRANEVYASSSTSAVLLPPQPVSANANEVTADWVVSVRFLNIRPFALAGVGLLVNVPKNSDETLTQTDTTAVYVYGAGLDVGLIPHFGLRLQYRGNVNKAPDLSKVFSSTGAFTHTAQPMAGLYMRF